jgi:hypothetical protein
MISLRPYLANPVFHFADDLKETILVHRTGKIMSRTSRGACSAQPFSEKRILRAVDAQLLQRAWQPQQREERYQPVQLLFVSFQARLNHEAI